MIYIEKKYTLVSLSFLFNILIIIIFLTLGNGEKARRRKNQDGKYLKW